MAKNRNFNNNINKENNNPNFGSDATNYIKDGINDEIGIEKVIPRKLNMDIGKELIEEENNKKLIDQINKVIDRPIFKPFPKNKIYSSNPDWNLIITTYVKCNKDLILFKKEIIKLGYLDLIATENEKEIFIKWNRLDINYLKNSL